MTWKPDYITVAELRAHLRTSDTADDALLATWVTAASRVIDSHCNRQFGQLAAPAGRTYRQAPGWDPEAGLWSTEIDDVEDITGMTIGVTAYAATGAVLLPENAPAESKPYTRIGYATWPTTLPLVVTARWGWSAVPPQVKAATKLQAARLAARRDSPFGVAGSPAVGSELRLLAKVDADVAVQLAGLRRRRRVG